jgi:hypothetical protein
LEGGTVPTWRKLLWVVFVVASVVAFTMMAVAFSGGCSQPKAVEPPDYLKRKVDVEQAKAEVKAAGQDIEKKAASIVADAKVLSAEVRKTAANTVERYPETKPLCLYLESVADRIDKLGMAAGEIRERSVFMIGAVTKLDGVAEALQQGHDRDEDQADAIKRLEAERDNSLMGWVILAIVLGGMAVVAGVVLKFMADVPGKLPGAMIAGGLVDVLVFVGLREFLLASWVKWLPLVGLGLLGAWALWHFVLSNRAGVSVAANLFDTTWLGRQEKALVSWWQTQYAKVTGGASVAPPPVDPTPKS